VDGATNTTGTVTVSGTAESGSTVEVFDGASSKGTASVDAGGAWTKTLTGVADGSHTYTAKATDAAGNTSPASDSRTLTVDKSAPQTTITAAPSDPTNATGASFEFSASEAGSTFECSLDGSPFSSCASPKSYTGLAEGSHTFEVQATDAAGNTDATPASRTWTVDTTAPETTITAGPSDPTTETSASFSFESSEEASTFECSLDGSAFAPCSNPQIYADVSAGSHTFEVKATDAAGNTDAAPATHTWTVT
jgi:large repetitive protein